MVTAASSAAVFALRFFAMPSSRFSLRSWTAEARRFLRLSSALRAFLMIFRARGTGADISLRAAVRGIEVRGNAEVTPFSVQSSAAHQKPPTAARTTHLLTGKQESRRAGRRV